MVFYFGALAFLPVAQAVAGLFTAPLFVLAISVVWLRVRPRAEVVAAVLIGLVGSLMVLRPDPSALRPALLLPIAGAAFYALSALATRRICAGESALSLLAGFFVAMLGFSVIGALATAGNAAPPGPDGFLARGWVAPSAQVLALTAVQAVASVICVGMITRAYILAEAPQVAVFEYSLLIFAAIWGFLLYDERIDAVGVLGMALILASGALLFRAERRAATA
jgi:drug/metabolite transporter (DMT)-like permease